MSEVDPDIVVVGAGLAGLTAAAYAARAGRSVLVYERAASPGGHARSVERDGFTFNQGAHALNLGGVGAEVLDDLGVTYSGGKPPIKGRVVFAGKDELAPAGPTSLLRTRALQARDKFEIAKLLGSLPRLNPTDHADLTVREWITAHVRGVRATQLVEALVRLATYCNAPDELSADVAITQLKLALDGPGVLYLDQGWQSLVDQLVGTPGITFRTGESLAELPDAPAVIVALGRPGLTGHLLGKRFDVGPAAHASCLDLGLSRRPTHDFVLGGDTPFYCSNHSAVADLAPDGQFHAALVNYLESDTEPDSDALQAFAAHAGINEADIITRRSMHKMMPVSSMPTALRGGMAGRPPVTDTGHKTVFMAGDWVGPVGHLADASFASGRDAALAAIDVVERAGSRVA